ncbi:hypothetical protein DINM_006488 [Dirofilaria immitis]|nr:hypothetical protein [Dirofilaria immitis]
MLLTGCDFAAIISLRIVWNAALLTNHQQCGAGMRLRRPTSIYSMRREILWQMTAYISLLFDTVYPITPYVSTTFQCPEGFYLSTFNTAFIGKDRYYKFACSAFDNNIHMQMNETCKISDSASSQLDDIYLSCGSDQTTTMPKDQIYIVSRTLGAKLIFDPNTIRFSNYDVSIYLHTDTNLSLSTWNFANECRRNLAEEMIRVINGNLESYTAGVRIIEDNSETFSAWQLLCCSGKSVKIRIHDCIDTKFLNEHRRSSTFFTGTQIIRKWQAVLDNNDLRWWLQLCPVDVINNKRIQDNASSRARRQIPWQWNRNRFDSFRVEPMFMKEDSPGDIRSRFFSNMHHAQTTSETPLLQFGTEQKTVRNSKKPIANRNTKTELVTEMKLSQSSTLKSLTNVIESTTLSAVQEDVAIDYYDIYDENFDKSKHASRQGILGVYPISCKIFRNSGNIIGIFNIRLETIDVSSQDTTTTTDGPAFLLSRDEDSLTIGMKHDSESSINNARLKLQRFGPKPSRPNASQAVSTSFKLGNPGAIQQMFQFFGLCKSHEL